MRTVAALLIASAALASGQTFRDERATVSTTTEGTLLQLHQRHLKLHVGQRTEAEARLHELAQRIGQPVSVQVRTQLYLGLDGQRTDVVLAVLDPRPAEELDLVPSASGLGLADGTTLPPVGPLAEWVGRFCGVPLRVRGQTVRLSSGPAFYVTEVLVHPVPGAEVLYYHRGKFSNRTPMPARGPFWIDRAPHETLRLDPDGDEVPMVELVRVDDDAEMVAYVRASEVAFLAPTGAETCEPVGGLVDRVRNKGKD